MRVVVDSSAWIAWFRGDEVPLLDDALEDGRVVLPPVVVAELVAGCRSRRDRSRVEALVRDANVAETPLEHWVRVGELRSTLARRGLAVSTPDAHVAQCALDLGAALLSLDKVFLRVAALSALRLAR